MSERVKEEEKYVTYVQRVTSIQIQTLLPLGNMQKPLNSFRGQNLLKINSFLP